MVKLNSALSPSHGISVVLVECEKGRRFHLFYSLLRNVLLLHFGNEAAIKARTVPQMSFPRMWLLALMMKNCSVSASGPNLQPLLRASVEDNTINNNISSSSDDGQSINLSFFFLVFLLLFTDKCPEFHHQMWLNVIRAVHPLGSVVSRCRLDAGSDEAADANDDSCYSWRSSSSLALSNCFLSSGEREAAEVKRRRI